MEAIRAYCMQCLALRQFNTDEVKNCTGDAVKCPFYPYRLGKRPSAKIIRESCLQCMGNCRKLVSECETTECPCYTYRMGKNPARSGKGYFADQNRKKRAETCS